jgi:hypothetical protein
VTPGVCAAAVKRALGERRGSSFEEICAALDLAAADWQNRHRLRKTLESLVRSGQVEFLPGVPLYRLDEIRGHTRQEKVWRAIVLKARKGEAFALLEVASLAGCSLDYTKKYCQFLAGKEILKHAGSRGHFRFWRLAPGLEGEAAPVWNRRAEKRRRHESSDRG